MRWRGVLALLFSLNGLAAQRPVIDSLHLELASLEKMQAHGDFLNKKGRVNYELGRAYHNNGAYQQAAVHLKNASLLARQSDDSLLLADVLNQFGENHLKQGATDSAIFYYNDGLTIACRIQSIEHIKTASARLYAIHKEQNNHAEALRYLELYQSVNDSLIKGEHIRTITRLEKDFSDRIERYEDKSKIQRQQLVSAIGFSGFTIAVFTILFLVVYYRLRQAKERDKRKIQEQLLAQERMASLGMLAAGIAHEIKNPLNFINNFAGINRRLIAEITAEFDRNPTSWSPRTLPFVKSRLHDLDQNSADIETSGKEINQIVHTMMDHSRGTSDSLRLVNLNELAEENINLVFHSYRASHPDLQVQILRQFDPELPKVEMYPQNIARVIANILSNAFYALNLKHQESPGFQPCLTVSTRALPGNVELRIRDNGPGIPAELRQKIFTPFFTTKPVGLGNTGLGLSISYNIVVHEHRGKLEVDSVLGGYAEFRVLLAGG